ncbi:uncharacterized protein LOC121091241 isoform X2 [Falco naumanni]|uniref:uncharacterized protein LOC121091241 isoform X2 n=1 Tax=Falco naumanni TaxID=148594 RepID=UPI001ADE2F7F|nr:uncharacterized protein LOC121091241 isoform X2 [Falco naumanni]
MGTATAPERRAGPTRAGGSAKWWPVAMPAVRDAARWTRPHGSRPVSAHLQQIYRQFPGCEYFILDLLALRNMFFCSDENVKVLTCPLLILHAEDDAVLPLHLGHKKLLGHLVMPPAACSSSHKHCLKPPPGTPRGTEITAAIKTTEKLPNLPTASRMLQVTRGMEVLLLLGQDHASCDWEHHMGQCWGYMGLSTNTT